MTAGPPESDSVDLLANIYLLINYLTTLVGLQINNDDSERM
jgi:hypothetical protein